MCKTYIKITDPDTFIKPDFEWCWVSSFAAKGKSIDVNYEHIPWFKMTHWIKDTALIDYAGDMDLFKRMAWRKPSKKKIIG